MTETKESPLESVKTIKFTGDEKKWRDWHKKVEAYAKVKGFHKALLDNEDKAVTEKMRDNALKPCVYVELLLHLWRMRPMQRKYGKNRKRSTHLVRTSTSTVYKKSFCDAS